LPAASVSSIAVELCHTNPASVTTGPAVRPGAAMPGNGAGTAAPAENGQANARTPTASPAVATKTQRTPRNTRVLAHAANITPP
jgi:hypothetical protein